MPRQRPAPLEAETPAPAKSQVICVASGKGGTGKSIVAANLSVLLARKGLKVTLIDADFGLANAHLLLGIEPKHDICDVLSGDMSLSRIIERGPAGIQLVPGGSGRSGLALMADADIDRLMAALASLEESSDIIVTDLAAGISPRIVRFLTRAHDIILVSNHETTARADVISTINMLAETLGEATVHLVVNCARDRNHATVTFQQLWARVNKLHRGKVKLFFSAWIPKSPFVTSSIMRGKPLVLVHPQSQPARCLETMCVRMHKHHLSWRSRQIGRWAAPSAFAKSPEPNTSPSPAASSAPHLPSTVLDGVEKINSGN
jgi:flagellar biosynthesis protein FlhG